MFAFNAALRRCSRRSASVGWDLGSFFCVIQQALTACAKTVQSGLAPFAQNR
jgi:hypothetical protein